MKLNNYKNILLSGLLLLAACKPKVDVEPASNGGVDFSAYIAVGDSQTAGYADGGLYRTGQINSFPNIIAEQLKAVGGGNFSQPLFSEAQASGTGYRKIDKFNADGTPSIIDVPATAVRSANPVLFTKYTGDNSNYGIPGIKVIHASIAGYGNLNPYFERVLTSSYPTANTTYLDYITAKPYTFFTSWLGNNDALGYATAGGVNEALTDKSVFAAAYSAVIEKLTAGGKKGAIATVPDVSAIPFFNTVTIPVLLAAVQRAAPSVTTLYVNARKTSDAGTATYEARAATTADLITLTFPTSKLGVNGYGVSPLNPIENQYVLDANEVTLVKDYVNAYNQTITSLAASKGLALFDAYAFLNTVKQKGLLINGVNLSAIYISGGLFSLDGVHLTPKGYAIIANEFIKATNAKYGSNVPQADINKYNSVIFP